MDNQTGTERQPARASLSETPAFLIAIGACVICAAYWLLLIKVYHFTNRQAVELAAYLLSVVAILVAGVALHVTRRSRREQRRVQPPLVMAAARDQRLVDKAWAESAVVLGYDIHGDPWLWPDRVRVMQGIVLGMTGTGKTTLLRNIITQDLVRRVGPPEDRHKIPMVIFDGKGDLEFFHGLLPHIHRAGRLQDLRLLNPARPDTSVLYNPFHTDDDNYMAQVNMVFGQFQPARRVLREAPIELSGRHRPRPALHGPAIQLLRRHRHGARREGPSRTNGEGASTRIEPTLRSACSGG